MSGSIIAVTMGDPAGIGPEIILKVFASGRAREKGIPVVIGDWAILQALKRRLNLDISLTAVSSVEEGAGCARGLPVLDQGLIREAGSFPVGKVTAAGGRAAVAYIQQAVDLALAGRVKGIATAPINKESLREAGFDHIGHTEMLSEFSGASRSVTMFMVDKMKIFFHSRHLSLKKMIQALSIEGVTESILLADKCLKSIGYEQSRLALAGLNPHASDGGLFGDEEAKILIPACQAARSKGLRVEGPIPADSVFHLALQGSYDGVIALYHDQGHIAAKTYDFHRTVSVTLGLPFLRTSVDHGTAFDIAWKGLANPISMEEAIRTCFELAGKYRPPAD